MKSWWRYLLVVLGVAALGWLAWQLYMYKALVIGKSWRNRLGGQWELEYRDSALMHSGPDVSLVRRERTKTVIVDVLVQDARYYGDDCVVYSTSRGDKGVQYLAACDSRQPAQLIPPTFDSWVFMDDRILNETESKKQLGQSMLISAIKSRARQQGTLKDKWFAR